jgi:parvulin-like peptidyl-prolyl isomerase
MVERAGGQVLTEYILLVQIRRRLEEQDLTLTQKHLDAERTLMLRTLHEDKNQAQRMLNTLRLRQGIGTQRYAQLLERNATMRLLLKDEVDVTDQALLREYDRRYGPRYETRLIVVQSAAVAAQLVSKAKAGRSFIDLAIANSTDESRAQGGLVGWISPADATWPKAVRQTIVGMKAGDISQPVALDSGFAVLQVVNKSEAQKVVFDGVKEELNAVITLNEQRRLMQQLMRVLLDEADVAILDAALKKSYEDSRRQPN